MARIQVDWDEWWPVLEILSDTDPYGRGPVDIPNEFVSRFKAAVAEFDECQRILVEFCTQQRIKVP